MNQSILGDSAKGVNTPKGDLWQNPRQVFSGNVIEVYGTCSDFLIQTIFISLSAFQLILILVVLFNISVIFNFNDFFLILFLYS